MFNTEYTRRDEDVERHRRGRACSPSRTIQHLGRPLPAAQRPRQPVWPVLREPLGPLSTACRTAIRSKPTGRDDGVMYWGQFGIAKVSFGAFDVQGLTKGDSDVLCAGRVQLDFWDPGGRLLPERHVLRRERSARRRRRRANRRRRSTRTRVDFLLEKKLGNSRRRHGRSRIREVRRAGRLSDAGGCRRERRLLPARRLHVPASRRHRKIPVARASTARPRTTS